MKKLGVAIIGCGNIAVAHVRGFKELATRCEVRAFCDMYEEKAKSLAERFDYQDITTTDDYRTLLDHDDIDVVSICLPPSEHCTITVDFLEAGKHVIVEKPMAPSLHECDAMIAAQEKSGKILSMISQNRFKDDPMRIKQMLEAGDFGKVLFARVNSMWWRGTNYYDLWWRGTYEQEGGGCTLIHAIHQIDILQWLVGMPKSVYSVMSNLAHPNSEVEDLSLSILRYENMFAQVASTLVEHDEKQELLFAAENASFSIPWSLKAVTQRPNGFFDPDEAMLQTLTSRFESLGTLAYERHTAQFEDIFLAIEEGGTPIVDGVQGRNAVELVCAMYKSSVEGVEVTLPIATDDPFYTTEGMLSKLIRYNKKLKSVENLEDSDITLGTT